MPFLTLILHKKRNILLRCIIILGSLFTTRTCDKSITIMFYIYDVLLLNTPSSTCSNVNFAYLRIKFAHVYVKNPSLKIGSTEKKS